MSLNKKIITALVLLLLVALPLFFSIAISVKQQVVQYQRNEKFKKEILQIITVSSANIYWVKPGKEILFDGKLFDVKSFITKRNCIILTGFFDYKEDKLVQQIVRLAKQENHSNNAPGIKFIFFPVYVTQPEKHYVLSWKYIPQQYYCFDEMLQTLTNLPASPPPKI